MTLNVIEGEWSIGPANRRLACVSLKGMTHRQVNDIELGVPMEHKFVLKFFQIESLLSDVWNLEFNKVLGPQDCDGQFVSAGDIDAETDYAMLCLVLHQLPKPEGNQVRYTLLIQHLRATPACRLIHVASDLPHVIALTKAEAGCVLIHVA